MISTEFREKITVTTVITGQTPANYIQSNLSNLNVKGMTVMLNLKRV